MAELRSGMWLLFVGLLAAGPAMAGAPAAAPTPIVWQFPDDFGPELRTALVAAQGEARGHHLVSEAALDAHLRRARLPEQLGCIDDHAVCVDPRAMALEMLGFDGRVEVTATRNQAGFEVRLRRFARTAKTPQDHLGTGPTLAVAAQAAWRRLSGHATVRIAVKPASAQVFLGEVLLGTGPGDYPVPPGEHSIKVVAPSRVPLTQTFKIRAGERVELSFEMGTDRALLALHFSPAGAKVWIDDTPWLDPTTPRELVPGLHTLRLEATDYEPHTYTLTAKAATRLDLEINLRPAEPEWRRQLRTRTPHADTQAHPYYLRAGLRFLSVGEGDVDLVRGRGDTRVEVEQQRDAVGLVGLDVALGWRGPRWTVEALSLGLEFGGDRADLGTDLGDAEMDHLSRTVVRIGQVGMRYPLWRIEPYAQTGPLLVFEDFQLNAPSRDIEDVEHTLFLWGLEFGARYHVTDEWFVSSALAIDTWIGARTSVSWLVGGGYALEMPSWLKEVGL